MLTSGFHAVPPGHVAAVVTHLTMEKRPPPRPAAFPEGVTLERISSPDPAVYRDLFARVGAADWMWFSRLAMNASRLAEVISASGTEIFAPMRKGRAEGLLELEFRDDESCMLAFFGLTPALQGADPARPGSPCGQR